MGADMQRRPMRYSGLMFENKELKRIEKQDSTPDEMDKAEGQVFMQTAHLDQSKQVRKK